MNIGAMNLICTALIVAAACAPDEPGEPDLPRQADRWVSSVSLDEDSEVKFIGKTRDYLVTTVSTVRDVNGLKAIRVGDEIEGIRIGAIRCSFHRRDASYGGEQFMWRGRWACQAGRDEEEVLNAVDDDGDKRFDYIYVGPVRLADD